MGLSVVSKKQLWQAESELPPDLGRPSMWHLKSIQDAILLVLIKEVEGLRVLEIGGGESRLLPWFATKNDCVLADPLDGRGGGPVRLDESAPFQVVKEAVGPDQNLLQRIEGFDIAFSISVVEHVPINELDEFFDSCHSIIKTGGRMIHLIDCYVTGDAPDRPLMDRLNRYLTPLQRGFTARDPSTILEPGSFRFETWMATNPDNAMSRWNQSVPALRPMRETHQSVSLLMDYMKAEIP